MSERNLKNKDIQVLLGVSFSTVKSWLYNQATCKGYRAMPANQYELLMFKLGGE